MALWKFFGASVEPVQANNIGQAVEQLRARLGTWTWPNGITLRSRRHYYHIPPRRKIEVRNCRPGCWVEK